MIALEYENSIKQRGPVCQCPAGFWPARIEKGDKVITISPDADEPLRKVNVQVEDK